MELRSELRFPQLDEFKVKRLAELAARIDGARPGEWEDELAEFNQLAGTSLEFHEFQGISGGTEHETWVRNTLSIPYAQSNLSLLPPEMLEIISRLCSGAGEEHEQFFWLKVLETHLDPRISDLIYWPGEYFGDGDNSRQLTPQDILEIALKRRS